MPSNTAIQKPKSVKSTKTKTRKKDSKKRNKTKVVVVEDIIEDDEIIEEEEVVVAPKTKRRTPTRESVLTSFEELITSVENEIQTLREGPAKIKGVKFLRSMNKNLKQIRNKAARVMKKKKKTTRVGNQNSGFKKPVAISSELAEFAGWKPDDLRSRVDVTTYICDYIKTHDLQNPEDRRQIQPDAKLQKLLKFDPKKIKEPLRYYSLQTYLKTHFIKKK